MTKFDTSEYTAWENMRQRCNNPRNNSYIRYGGRGIKVCERWDNFSDFINDLGTKPTPKHSLDRINNDGNYEPSNCRWATPSEQGFNRRTKKTNTSGITGVSKAKTGWRARITVNYKEIFLGTYPSKSEAHKARITALSTLQETHG